MKEEYKNNWISFYPQFGQLSFRFGPASYFDTRWNFNCYLTLPLAIILTLISMFILPVSTSLWFLMLSLIPWGKCFVYLPINSKYEESCDDYPEYGFYFYAEGTKIPTSFWICKGMKKKMIELPWALTWIRTSALRKDGTWEHEIKGSSKDFYEDKWKDILLIEKYPYIYKLKGGETQERNATIKVQEREWRPIWFKWTKLFSYVRRSIDIEFDDEVGERTGSWKGGVIGCGYDMKKDETPYECLKRMENEREFR